MKDLVDIIPDYNEKVGNMNARVLAARDAESAGYAHYMAKMLAASDAQRQENRKLAEIRKQRHGIDPNAQQPSTQAILARPKEQDLEHFLRPIPQSVIEHSKKLYEAYQKGDDGAIKQLVGERTVTIEEVSHVEATRRRPKNSQGQSEKSAIPKEKREAAIHAYLCSGPAVLTDEDKQRILTKIASYTPLAPIPPVSPKLTQPKSLAGRFFHWLWKRGVPMDKITRKDLKIEEADKHE